MAVRSFGLAQPSSMGELRVIRDRMLRETDWTQLPDAPVDAEAWAVYRQKLRDLPEMENPVWPLQPTH